MARRATARPGEIPDKSYFKIGEVARIVAVPASALRFWEAQFPAVVRPEKSRTGQRQYRRRDVEALLRIRALLHDKRFTIAGARKQLRDPDAPEPAPMPKSSPEPSPVPPSPAPRAVLPEGAIARIRAEARALLDLVGAEDDPQ